MAHFYDEPSHTFSEYLLIPRYTSHEHTPDNVSLKTPLTRFRKDEEPAISLNVPVVSAIMQSVSNDKMAIALAREGGLSFIFCSQSVENQSKMVEKVKNYKAGFVVSDSTLKEDASLQDVLDLSARTKHTTIAITDDGNPHGKLLGVVTSRDYRIGKTPIDAKVKEFMTPIEKLQFAYDGVSLSEANDKIWEHKLNSLPVITKEGNMVAFVFRKDYQNNKENPNELLDDEKRFMVGAGVNTRDYKERIPALVKAGVNALCLDSSDGFSQWQADAIKYTKENFNVPIGAGNVVDADGFNFLADAGADFIKVGIGGGSICITRETKGIGRGQATAVIEVAKARDAYFEKNGVYIPICSDGGIVFDYHMTLAYAMGADFCMLGRYFARFDESPTNRVLVNGNYVKEYWGEGSARARNWQRYDSGGDAKLSFEEGVDSYVPYAGKLHDNLQVTLEKIKATMCNCGSLSLAELRKNAKLTLVSAASIVEGGPHDVILKDSQSSKF
ncbi:MAG: IMP dehydrogenase [Treponemataceae bacterium]